MKTRKSYKKIIGDYAFQSFETQARANEQATDFVTEALTGSYAPHMITYRGNIGIMTREPSGWTYDIVASRSNTEALYPVIDNVERLNGCHGPQSFDVCQRDMLVHLAQNAYIHGDTAAPDFVPATDRHDIERYYRFQNRYAEHRSAGYDDAVSHQYACTG